jgi:hypothetical protein
MAYILIKADKFVRAATKIVSHNQPLSKVQGPAIFLCNNSGIHFLQTFKPSTEPLQFEKNVMKVPTREVCIIQIIATSQPEPAFCASYFTIISLACKKTHFK